MDNSLQGVSGRATILEPKPKPKPKPNHGKENGTLTGSTAEREANVPKCDCLSRSAKVPRTTPLIGDAGSPSDQHTWITSPIGRVVIELERCRQALEQAIRHCLGIDFSYVACAISCVLSSLRPLRARELSAAVDLFVEFTDAARLAPSGDDDERSSGEAWLDKCDSVLVVDDSGLVRFASSFMPHFLMQNHIQGIDVTHQTIATACLIQVELDEKSNPSGEIGSAASLPPDCGFAFSRYAGEFWRAHCRNAEESSKKSNPRNIPVSVPRGAVAPTEGSGLSVVAADMDLDSIESETSAIDGDEMDWVLVPENGEV